MNNNEYGYFLSSKWGLDASKIKIEKFHICTWLDNNNREIIEFGCQVRCLKNLSDDLELSLYIPWLMHGMNTFDLYDAIKESCNAKFIFNELIDGVKPYDKGDAKTGVKVTFENKKELIIIPVKVSSHADKILNLEVKNPSGHCLIENDCLYFRFCVIPTELSIPQRIIGFSQKSFVYDIKVNMMRNIPKEIDHFNLCHIDQCFCLNIVPAKFSISFKDDKTFKSVRMLEVEAFNRYIEKVNGLRSCINPDSLMVVFNKQIGSRGLNGVNSYLFFTKFSDEIVDTSQIVLAIGLNIICSILCAFCITRWVALVGAFIAIGIALTVWRRKRNSR